MKNRVVGFLVIGIALLIGFVIYSFNKALTDIVNTACSHGAECPMWGSIEFQTNISIGVMALIVLIGLYLVFFGQDERIITKFKRIQTKPEKKELTKESYTETMKTLDAEGKLVLEKIIEAQGTMFQSDIVEKTGLNKVKVTRILD
ncbi:MAG: hypothetical protein V1731_02515, partial [Candidatus Aenigmatarchaeota archaeon]